VTSAAAARSYCQERPGDPRPRRVERQAAVELRRNRVHPEVGPWTRVRRRQRGGDAPPALVPASAPAAVLAGERASVAAQQASVAVQQAAVVAAEAVAAPVQAAAAVLAPAVQVCGCRLPLRKNKEAASLRRGR